MIQIYHSNLNSHHIFECFRTTPVRIIPILTGGHVAWELFYAPLGIMFSPHPVDLTNIQNSQITIFEILLQRRRRGKFQAIRDVAYLVHRLSQSQISHTRYSGDQKKKVFPKPCFLKYEFSSIHHCVAYIVPKTTLKLQKDTQNHPEEG